MADELSFAGSMPVWAQWSMVVLLVMLSAMFSGLTLGVLSLDKTVLEVPLILFRHVLTGNGRS